METESIASRVRGFGSNLIMGAGLNVAFLDKLGSYDQ